MGWHPIAVRQRQAYRPLLVLPLSGRVALLGYGSCCCACRLNEFALAFRLQTRMAQTSFAPQCKVEAPFKHVGKHMRGILSQINFDREHRGRMLHIRSMPD